jgi:gallate dioxygenase
MNPQLEGVEKLGGTYVFDLATSARGLRLNRFLHGMIIPAKRELFKRDPEAAYEQAGLTNEERDLLRRLDWRAMLQHGASFFCLEKLGKVTDVSNPMMVAAFRGETLEAFLKTRNVPGAR